MAEALRHQRAADKETLVLCWRAMADAFVNANTDLDAVDDPLAYNHAVRDLAGVLRETVGVAIEECESEWLATRKAGQRRIESMAARIGGMQHFVGPHRAPGGPTS